MMSKKEDSLSESNSDFQNAVANAHELLVPERDRLAEQVQNGLNNNPNLDQQVKETAKQINNPPELSAVVNDAGNLITAAKTLEQKNTNEEQIAHKLVGAVQDFKNDLDALQNSSVVNKGVLSTFLNQIQNLGQMGASLVTHSLKYHRLSKSESSFPYWLETQLAKRQINQEKLNQLTEQSSNEHADALQQVTNLNHFFNKSKDKLAKDITPLSQKAYAKAIEDQITALKDVFVKQYSKGEHQLSSEEKHLFNNNKDLIAFFIGVPVDQLQKSTTKEGEEQVFQEDRVSAFSNHLAQQHLSDRIQKRDQLINNRLIANFNDLDDDQKKQVKTLLVLDQDLQETINQLPNLSQQRIELAKRENDKYVETLQGKVHDEKIVLIAKTLLLASAILLVAGCIAMLCAAAPYVLIPIFAAAVIAGIIAMKLYPNVINDLTTGIKDFFEKYTKEMHLLDVKDEQNQQRDLLKPSQEEELVEEETDEMEMVPLFDLDDDVDEEEAILAALETTDSVAEPNKKNLTDYINSYKELRQDPSSFKDYLATGLGYTKVATSVIGPVVQDVLNQGADLGNQVKDLGKQVTNPPWLAPIVDGLGSALSAVQNFAKAGFAANTRYDTQAVPINDLIGVAKNVEGNIDKIHNAENTNNTGVLVTFINQIENLGKMSASIVSSAVKFRRLYQSNSDFPYWLETQLAKRHLMQKELSQLDNMRQELDLGQYTKAIEQLPNLESHLFNKTEDKIASDITPLAQNDYNKALEEKLTTLNEIFTKQRSEGENQLSDEEKFLFNHNKELIAFLVGVPVDQVQTSAVKEGDEQVFQEQRVLALLLHLEHQHLNNRLDKREQLIKNRIIAKFDGLEENEQNKVKDLLYIEKGAIVDIDRLNELDDDEVKLAKAANKTYEGQLNEKVQSEKNLLIAKTLLFVSVGILIAGTIAIACAAAPYVVVPLLILGVIVGLAALKINSNVLKDLTTDIKDFFANFSKEINLSDAKKEREQLTDVQKAEDQELGDVELKTFNSFIREDDDEEEEEDEEEVEEIGSLLEKGLSYANSTEISFADEAKNVLTQDSDLDQQVKEMAKQINNPPELSAVVNDAGNLINAAKTLEQKNTNEEQITHKLVDDVQSLKNNLDALQNSSFVNKGVLSTFLNQIQNLGQMGASLVTHSMKYHRLSKSESNFSYWLEIQSAKQQINQEKLNQLTEQSSNEHADALQQVTNLNHFFNKSKDKLAKDITPLSQKAYTKAIEDQITALKDVFVKQYSKGEHQLSSEEKLLYNNNKDLIAFFVGVPVDQLQKTTTKEGEEQAFQEDRVLAFSNHLAQQHLSDRIQKREQLINNRLIANFNDLDDDKKEQVKTLLQLAPDLQETISQAKRENDQYVETLQKKVHDEKIVLIAKTLLLASAILLVAGCIAMLCAAAPYVLIPIFAAAVIAGIIAMKLYPNVINDLTTGIKDFFEKYTKEMHLLDVKDEQNQQRDLLKPSQEEELVEEETDEMEMVPLFDLDDDVDEIEAILAALETTPPAAETSAPKSLTDFINSYKALRQNPSSFKDYLATGLGYTKVATSVIGPVVQDVLNQGVDLGNQVKDLGKQVTNPPWLAPIVDGLGSVLSSVQNFAKAGFAANTRYDAQAVPINDLIGVGKNLEGNIDKIHNAENTNNTGILVTFINQIESLGKMSASIVSSGVKFRRLSQSNSDFPYWLETQLAKRHLMQKELSQLDTMRQGLDLGQYTKAIEQLPNLESHLFNKTEDKIASDITPLAQNDYNKVLEEKLTTLNEIFTKQRSEGENQLSDEEKFLFNHNKELIAFLVGVPVDEVQTSAVKEGDEQVFQEQRVQALLLHLDHQHLNNRLDKREQLIKNRIIAKFDGLEENEQNKVKDLLYIEKGAIVDIDRLNELDDDEVKLAKAANKTYEGQLNEKVQSEKNLLIAKTLLLVSVGILIAGTIAIACAAAPYVVIPLLLIGVIVGLAALKINSNVLKDLTTDIKDFFANFSKEINLSDAKNERQQLTDVQKADDKELGDVELTTFNSFIQEDDDEELEESDEEEIVEMPVQNPPEPQIEAELTKSHRDQINRIKEEAEETKPSPVTAPAAKFH